MEDAATATPATATGREELAEKHRKEVKELRAKAQALRKGVSKGDKKKKKEVTAEVKALEEELDARHKAEVAELAAALQCSLRLPGEQSGSSMNGSLDLGDAVSDAMAKAEQKDGGAEAEGTTKKSKAQKRRAKKAQLERERAQRIADSEAVEAAAGSNPRQLERERLSSILTPLGLAVKDITPDGHCLYAAISHQLSVKMNTKVPVTELRLQCADYMRSHGTDFLPFLTDSQTGDQFNQDQFEEYCREIADTAAWGGQLEILAFSHIFQVPIKVYQASAPLMCIGEEYQLNTQPLTLSYHLHEFGLGEHYNSITSKEQPRVS